jgi:hypothetical protein
LIRDPEAIWQGALQDSAVAYSVIPPLKPGYWVGVILPVLILDAWVTRFLNRNKDQLISLWTTLMTGRHEADSGHKYSKYFELLHGKMPQYEPEPRHTYIMDEKGFMIGCTGRSKRIFARALYGQKRLQHIRRSRTMLSA